MQIIFYCKRIEIQIEIRQIGGIGKKGDHQNGDKLSKIDKSCHTKMSFSKIWKNGTLSIYQNDGLVALITNLFYYITFFVPK